MQNHYNMNQLSLAIPTYYEPDKNNTAWYINELVEALAINEPYFFGRPCEYDLSAMLKLILFAYTRSVFSSRRIEQFAEESLPAQVSSTLVDPRNEIFLSNDCPFSCFG